MTSRRSTNAMATDRGSAMSSADIDALAADPRAAVVDDRRAASAVRGARLWSTK